MSGNWVVLDGRLRASASNCRLVPRFIDASRFVSCARWVSVLATYPEGTLPLVVHFPPLAGLAGGRTTPQRHSCPGRATLSWCSFGPRVFARRLGCGTLKGRWVFTASDRPLEALSLGAYDCRARCLPSTVKVDGCSAAPASKRNATWLILPVVICLSQRLSHACVSMNKFRL